MTPAARAVTLALALILYGLAGAPAPPGLGLTEAVIGLCLIAATGFARPAALFSGAMAGLRDAPAHERVGCPVFLLLFWLPLLRGAGLDWGEREMLRDIVPLLFLFLPVLLAGPLRPARRFAVAALGFGLAVAGTAFAARWWIDQGWAFGAVGRRAMSDGTRYLLNSPAVLFAAVWLPAAALRLLWPQAAPPLRSAARRAGRLALAAPALLAAALILAALAGAVHRMGLTLACGALLVLVATSARRTAGGPALLAAAPILAVALAPGGPLAGAVELALIKSEAVGFNERFAEAEAVFAQIARSPVSLLFGDGWGALVANPAVGGWRVAYTHSFTTYLLLKTGILGTGAFLAWLGTLAPLACRFARRDLPLALATLPPLAGGLLLHTSYKYLGFGLLLTVVVLAGEEDGRETGRPAVPALSPWIWRRDDRPDPLRSCR